jgi:hypothetical protein
MSIAAQNARAGKYVKLVDLGKDQINLDNPTITKFTTQAEVARHIGCVTSTVAKGIKTGNIFLGRYKVTYANILDMSRYV